MSDASVTKLNPCGCCATESPAPRHDNRPGLPALNYRVGTHEAFLRRMLARLSQEVIPDGPHQGTRPLAALSTRATDDPAIALLDAWSVTADVLTFYQERLANEGFLRTATERRSILELARAIGYELKPGVAAETWLAFDIEDAKGAPEQTTIDVGVKVMSIPGPDEKPQTFETVERIEARPEWNKLRPQLTQPAQLDLAAKSIYLKGTQTRLKPGDVILLAKLLLPPETSPKPEVRVVRRVEVDDTLSRTRVDFAADPAPKPSYQPPVSTPGVVVSGSITLQSDSVKQNIISKAWSNRDLSAFMYLQAWPARELVHHLSAPPSVALPPAASGVFAFRARAGFFGHNAPKWSSLPLTKVVTTVVTNPPPPGPISTVAYQNDVYPKDWDGLSTPNPATKIWENSQGTQVGRGDADVYLERAFPELVTDGWVVFASPGVGPTPFRIGKALDASLADYGLSGKATGLVLNKPNGDSIDAADKAADFLTRKTTAYLQSEALTLADVPLAEEIPAGTVSLPLDRLALGLRLGQVLIWSGERQDLPGVINHEAVRLTDIAHIVGFTTLAFEALETGAGLAHPYLRSTVTLNANVARATHGETVREVLGSGNGAAANQKFLLKRPPLTHISAKTSSGSKAELTLRVNSVEWEQRPSLFEADDHAQAFSVRIDDDGKATLIFGDGVRGARLPTGVENVTAVYRTGIGPEGEVKAGSLTMLMTKPLGVRGVNNPLAASGAEAPEFRDAARENAPSTVLTLDRIVSLQDFADFANAFAGIGKARAEALWQDESHLVQLTVANSSGQSPGGGDTLIENMRDALDEVRDPSVRVVVAGFRPALFRIGAELRIDLRYEFDLVRTAAETALRDAFGFAKRGFAQPVSAAEVVTLLQNIEGVVAVDLNQLHDVDAERTVRLHLDPVLNPLLPSEAARFEAATKTFLAAELLLLDPAGVDLTEKSS